MTDRPNILLITSDQQRADGFGFENPHLKTPHIDLLAQQGTRFAACVTPNLVCQPSRASILTGLLPLSHGVWDNGVDLDPHVGEAGFAGTLTTRGYSTALIGKAHFSTKSTFQPTGTPECRQSGARYGPAWYGPYMGFQHVELTVLGHLHRTRPLERPPVGHYERWLLSRAPDELPYRLWAQSLGPDVGAAQTWYSALPAAWHASTWIAERVIAYLTAHRRDQPFWHRAVLEGMPQLSDPVMLKFRTEGSRVPDQTDKQLAHMTANYYGMISQIDHNVGRILEALDALGLRHDTLVVYTTDHGELLGHHGLYLKHPIPYEDLLRVGLIIRGPGVRAGQVATEPVSTLDLAATFYDYVGPAGPEDMQSHSLRPLLQGHGETRDVAYSEWHVHPSRCGVALKLRTVRTKTHKCTFELESDAGELYDLVNDPEEMVNRFDDASYAKIRKELTAMMLARPGKILEDLSEPVGMA
jgi:arylsulfatase A-like enzyme